MGIGAGYEWVSGDCLRDRSFSCFLFSVWQKTGLIISIRREITRFETDFKEQTMKRFEKCFQAHHLKYKRGPEIKDGDSISGEWFVRGSKQNHLAFINEILNDPEIRRFEY